MNKSELVKKMAEKSGVSQAKAQRALNSVIDSISEELKSGGKVSLVGFGTFSVSERAARKGRNPRTGEELLIPESKSPKFKPGKSLKDQIS